MQDRLSAATVQSLNLRLPTSGAPARGAPILQAYECYARARRLWFRLEKGSLDQSRKLFEQAASLDPSHAPTLAGLAAVHAMRFTFTTDPEELEKAVSYARRSIEADPRLAEPRIWLGYALLRPAKPLEAYEEERQVMKLDPSLAFGAYFAACALLVAGRREEALPLNQKAVETDPQLGFAGWGSAGLTSSSAIERRRAGR
jgi:tetratricopeptide (TPR) repeat protein